MTKTQIRKQIREYRANIKAFGPKPIFLESIKELEFLLRDLKRKAA